MNAAGIGLSGITLYRYAAEGGAGALVTKSIGLSPNQGFNGPNAFESSSFTLINSMGLPNPGIKNYKLEIEDAKKANVPLILSIFGESAKECRKVAETGISYGIDLIEINVSCPHTKLRRVEESPELVKEIVKEVSVVASKRKIPVSVKISANTDYMEVAKAAVEGGANVLTAINTLRVRPIDPSLKIPILGSPSGYGGKSGAEIASISKKVLRELYEELQVPIFSAGGILTAKEAIERFELGATACQLGTVIAYEGIRIFEKMKREVKDYLRREGVENIREIIGTRV